MIVTNIDMKIEHLSLSALKYFLDAVDLGSITLSSEMNHISRPAVSQAIVRLEQWYGKTLLSHEKRNFALTADGKKFYILARSNFENLRLGFSAPEKLDHSFRIGCSASLLDLVFPKIQNFIKKSTLPVVKIGPTNRLLELLEQKEIRLAFLIGSQKGAGNISIELHSGRFELRSRTGKLTETLIVSESRPEVDAFQKFAFKKKLGFSRQIEVESWTVANRLAEMTDGTCLVPDCLAAGKLKPVGLKSWIFPYAAQAIYQKRSLLSELELEMIHQLEIKTKS